MGYWATEWYYDTAPEIPASMSRQIGADRIHRVLGYLCAKADDDTATANPSQQTIADALGGMERRDVRAAIGVLERLGLIVPVAPGVPRVRGVTYKLELSRFPGFGADSGGIPERIRARLGRAAPPEYDDFATTDSGGVPVTAGADSGGVPAEHTRDSGGASGGVPRHNQYDQLPREFSNGFGSRATPPEDSQISQEDLEAITNPRIREAIAVGSGLKPRRSKPAHPTPPGLEPLEQLAAESFSEIARRGGMG